MRHEKQDKQIKAHHKQPPPITGADHLPPLCHTPRAARLRALKYENMLTAGTGALQNSGERVERVVATKGKLPNDQEPGNPLHSVPTITSGCIVEDYSVRGLHRVILRNV